MAAALLIAHQLPGSAVASGLFLSHFGASALPTMVMAGAASAVLCAVAFSRTLRSRPPAVVVPAALAVSGFLHIGEWALARREPGIAALLIFLHVSALGSVFLSGFWSILNESLDPHTARAYFSRISAAGTAGGVAGGVIVAAFLPGFSALLFMAAVHAAAACAITTAPASARQGGSPHVLAAYGAAVNTFKRWPYLLQLAGLIVVSACAAQILDLIFKTQASGIFTDRQSLVRFFAMYRTALAICSVPLQALVSGIALRKAGVAATSAVLPSVVAVGSIGAAAVPGFGIVAGLRGAEALFRASLFRSAYELLYTPLPVAEKRSAKAVIDVGADRLGDAVGAAIAQSLLSSRTESAYRMALVAAGLLAGAGTVITRWVGRGYVLTLERNLLDRAVELDVSDLSDLTTRTVVSRTLQRAAVAGWEERRTEAGPNAPNSDHIAVQLADLRSADAGRVRTAATSAGVPDAAIIPQLIRLLGWNEVSADARAALGRAGVRITGQLVDSLLDEAEDFAVRRRIPAVLANCGTQRAADGLLAGLSAERFEVRFQCGRAMDEMFQRHPGLKLDNTAILDAIRREVAVAKPLWDSYVLLDSRTPDNRCTALDEVLAGRAHHGLEHVFSLLALILPRAPVKVALRALHTNDRQLRGAALEYLDNALPCEIHRRLWDLIGEMPPMTGARTTEQIVETLLESHRIIMERLSEDQPTLAAAAGTSAPPDGY